MMSELSQRLLEARGKVPFGSKWLHNRDSSSVVVVGHSLLAMPSYARFWNEACAIRYVRQDESAEWAEWVSPINEFLVKYKPASTDRQPHHPEKLR